MVYVQNRIFAFCMPSFPPKQKQADRYIIFSLSRDTFAACTARHLFFFSWLVFFFILCSLFSLFLLSLETLARIVFRLSSPCIFLRPSVFPTRLVFSINHHRHAPYPPTIHSLANSCSTIPQSRTCTYPRRPCRCYALAS